jgi:thymidylate synthase (FAD)
MKVKLIQMTQNPIEVMWTAARTCYSEKSPVEIWEDSATTPTDKKWNLVKKVLDSGHSSIAEHCFFTFCIEGVSRALLAQITRHRAGIVFSVQSQRYVEIKEDYKVIGDDGTITNENNYLERTDLISILDNYFVWDHDNYAQFHTLLQALYCYLYQVQEMNMKPEDARMVLPNATKTNITMSINLRELIHVSNLRLCTRAQLEIRLLFQAIKKEVEQVDKRLGDLLVPSCVSNGCCKEIKPCYYYKKVLKDEK